MIIARIIVFGRVTTIRFRNWEHFCSVTEQVGDWGRVIAIAGKI